MKKIGADKLALNFAENGMGGEGVLHFRRPRLESFQEVPVAAVEIVDHVRQLKRRRVRIESDYPVNNVVRALLVGRVEVAGLDCRLKRAHDDPGWIRAQI